jgi:predicted nuclease of predicted toxin-antitoxin system
MQIKVDEDLPNMVLQLLQERGYAAAGVVEQGMGGWKDPELWQAVQAEQRFLVTADKGFADVRLYPPGSHSGVLLLRPDEDGIRPVIDLLERVLSSFDLTALVGTITVVNP